MVLTNNQAAKNFYFLQYISSQQHLIKN